MSGEDSARVVEGTVTYAETGDPAARVVVQVKDADLLVDDPIGSATTDADGHFSIEYDIEAYVNQFLDAVDRPIERAPDIYLEVRDRTGALLGSTEEEVLYEADTDERIDVELPGEGASSEQTGGQRPERSAGGIPDELESDVEPVPGSDFIEFVKIDTRNPTVGESVSVVPVLDAATAGQETRVAINGVPGPAQTLQFREPGEKLVTVSAFRMEAGQPTAVDHQTVEVEVEEVPPTEPPQYFQPILGGRQVVWDGLTVEFTVENATDYGAANPDYRWLIDDRELVTDSPTLRYDFEGELSAGSPYETFDVAVEVRGDSTRPSQQRSRTVSVWNRDFINRTQGTVELRPGGEPRLVREEGRYTIPYELHNPGPTLVEIDTRQVEMLLPKEADAEPLRAPEDVSFAVPAASSVTRTFSIPASEVPAELIGIGLHLVGRTEPELEVYGSVYAEVTRHHPLAQSVTDPDLSAALENAFAMEPADGVETSIPVPDLLGEGDHQPDERHCNDTRKSRVISDLTRAEVLDSLPDVSPLTEVVDGDVVSDGGVVPEQIPDAADANEGDQCHPAQNHLRSDLVCTRTGEREQMVIPGRILNARRGDVILSPGGGSAVAKLLRHVSPIEVYSHAGIMTVDFLNIRHSTESLEWLVEQRSPLLDPEALTYGWPGAITQAIDGAYHGSAVSGAPGGESYSISAFSNQMRDEEGFGIVHPEVVKPDPRKEYQFPDLRPLLQEVGDSAESLAAHYRYYEYTQARSDSKVSKAGSNFSKTPWWDQSRPSVCSTFIWGAIKTLPDPPLLETDKTPLDRGDLESQDADLGAAPKDGLYRYTREEREAAATWLHHFVLNKARNLTGAVAGALKAPRKLANAVTNSFASDLTGFKENGLDRTRRSEARTKERWEDPGTGQTVSPDGIRNYWDAPEKVDGERRGLYGHTETLVYRPGEATERPVYRWEQATPEAQDATLDVSVVFEGQPLPNVELTGWGDTTVTDGNGEVQLTLDPGSYSIRAQKVHEIGGHEWYLSGDIGIDLPPGAAESRTIQVERPNEMFRRVEFSGSMTLLDPNWPTRDDKRTFTLSRKLARLQPSRPGVDHDERSRRTYSWLGAVNEESRGELRVGLECQDDGSIRASFTTTLYEDKEGLTSSEQQESSGSIAISKGEKESFDEHLKIRDPVTDSPEIWINATIRNHQARN